MPVRKLKPVTPSQRFRIINGFDSITTDITKEITILGEVTDVSVFTTKTRLRIATLVIKDDTGVIRAKWFGPQDRKSVV